MEDITGLIRNLTVWALGVWGFLKYKKLDSIFDSILANEIYFTWSPEGYFSRPMKDLEMTLLGPFKTKREATFAAYKVMTVMKKKTKTSCQWP